ncbi:pectin lyase-like protein, partial [Colletotrichum sublineola]
QDGYWLSEMGSLGVSPFAASGYQVFRNVKDFGASGNGIDDDTEAINRAAASFSISNSDDLRCGDDCGSSTTLMGVVYFPPGKYLVSSPIIQYYYTQFVGNPWDRPTIVGSAYFEGIALFDANVYIPDGNGDQWYVNQSNFFRQIRNFIFDLTGMPNKNYQHDQEYVPAGVHWQVGQATSISHCHFEMPINDINGEPAEHIGIFMENGSGGSVNDLSFYGGNIGFVAGSQQFTAINLHFTLCATAIKHEWNWGFVWKNIYVQACWIAIDCTAFSETVTPPQGTGSITVLDSHFNGVPYAITVSRQNNQQPNIVLENLLVENSESVVLVSGGETLLQGSTSPLFLDLWASGYQVRPNGFAGSRSGFIDPKPNKPGSLLDASGKYFYREKPQYPGTRPLVATNHGVSNEGTGDQTAAINRLLAGNIGSTIFFPAGVYLVRGTVEIPPGSKIVGSSWSTIMGAGSYFEDEEDPKVMIQVGKPGDRGSMEISDMLFTVRGNTAGCILMEWNIHESGQGSAAMWDSHFRVGGNAGSDLLLDDCPARSGNVDRGCMAAVMLLHLTAQSSAYFDNVWVWVADHDLDDPANANAHVGEGGIPQNSMVEISVYAGRGVLIESQGPTWMWGCGSEHAQLYQWQVEGAKDLIMGHVQTETPYYQSDPDSLTPYRAGAWEGDPEFNDCGDDKLCLKAWALRVINSTDIFLYGLGFYSFFDDFELGCAPRERCQQSLIETARAGRVWLYNIFTKGNAEIVSPQGNLQPLWFNDTTRNGYTSNVAAWLSLALRDGSGSGEDGGNDDDENGEGGPAVYIDPTIWTTSSGGGGGSTSTPTIQCSNPCTYVLPPRELDRPTTIKLPRVETTLEIGWFETERYTDGNGAASTTRVYVTTKTTTTITFPAITTTRIDFWNEVVNVTSTTITPTSSVPVPPITLTDRPLTDWTGSESQPTITRTITPPPWPWPEDDIDDEDWEDDDDDDDDDDHIIIPPIVHTRGPPKPTCRSGCGIKCRIFCDLPCLLNC